MQNMRNYKEEGEIESLPTDIISHIFFLISSFPDLAQASCVCKKWREGVKQSLGRRKSLNFSGCIVDDVSLARLVHLAFSLKELDMSNCIRKLLGPERPKQVTEAISKTPVIVVRSGNQQDSRHNTTVDLIISRSRWGCQITDNGLFEISMAKCVGNLTSVSLWGMTGITDKGAVQLVSRATNLQHLNIGGTFVTDESLFAVGNNCLHLKSIVLWSCRHVTETGLLFLVNKCRKLESINVWGTRVPLDCFIGLLTISPALQIKPTSLLPNVEAIPV